MYYFHRLFLYIYCTISLSFFGFRVTSSTGKNIPSNLHRPQSIKTLLKLHSWVKPAIKIPLVPIKTRKEK